MENASQLTAFGAVFVFIIMGVVFVLVTFGIAGLVAPKKPSVLKLSTYECGEEPSGNSWIQFNSRFYIVALVFLLFDVEMVFIFPWATVFGQQQLILADARWGWLSLAEMFVFVGILLLGLVYVWMKGDLEWIRPRVKPASAGTAIPPGAYEQINKSMYVVKAFEPAHAAKPEITDESAKPAAPPRFKPVFKNPAPDNG